jgi:Amt family ammonium transporter
VLAAQLIGSAIVTTSTLVVGLALMYAVKATGHLRVTAEGELRGLDLHEHGIPAYPEYALHPSATPQGAPDFAAAAYSSSPVSLAKTAPSH